MRVRLGVAAVIACVAAAVPGRADEGMWMLHQLPEIDARLRTMGLELTPKQIWDPATNTGLASAIPWLGGCTSSFVSPDGLIITNHHCAFGAVQMNSSPAHDYITDGFLAATRADELPARAQRVWVFKGYEDVTAKVRPYIEAAAAPLQRTKALEAREKQLVAECEASGLYCRIAEMYGGGKFYMFRQLELRDVRLVYAPARAIGEFGGEIDNWMWPRHTGDYSFFRAYVGADGKPADYSPSNVPFKPDRFLKLAPAGVKAGDFTMIIGYPGRTMRYRIAALVAQDTEFGYPYQIKLLSDWMAVLDRRAGTGKDVEIKVASVVKGLANAMKKYQGMVEGLTKEDLAGRRRAEEAKLQTWIDADPARKAKWGDVLPALDAQAAAGAATRERDILVRYLPRAGSLLPAALTIVRWSQQSGKPDVERDLGFQARDERTIRMRLRTMQRNLDIPTDRAVLAFFFERAAALPAGQRLPALDAALAATGKTGGAAVAALVDEILGQTSLADEKTRLGLLGLDEAAVAAKHDSLLGFAIALRRDMQAVEDERKTEEGVLVELTPRYIDALAAFRGAPLYPDANSTHPLHRRHGEGVLAAGRRVRRAVHDPARGHREVRARRAVQLPPAPDGRLRQRRVRPVRRGAARRRAGVLPLHQRHHRRQLGLADHERQRRARGPRVRRQLRVDDLRLRVQQHALAHDQRGHPLRPLVHGLRRQRPRADARDGRRAGAQVRPGVILRRSPSCSPQGPERGPRESR